MVPVTLHSGALELRLAPTMGGAVTAFTFNGQPVLRTADDAGDVLQTAAFPLLPFAGRITDGAFSFEGRTVQLAPNFPPEPHAIHGEGWRAAWQVAEQTDDCVRLVHEHDGTNWPWRYRAEQHFVLSETGLRLTFSLTNLDNTPMPAGLGWHPFFPHDGAMLDAPTRGVWLSSRGPSAEGEAFGLQSRAASSLNVDHAYEWPARQAHISLPHCDVNLSASDLFGHLVVYAPQGQPFFCVEPWSHVPGALNLPQGSDVTGQRTLAPGAQLIGWIDLRVSAKPL